MRGSAVQRAACRREQSREILRRRHQRVVGIALHLQTATLHQLESLCFASCQLLGGERAGVADGSALGPAGSGERAGGPGFGTGLAPAFDIPVAPGGYAWWYLDALSDDGRHGITVIAFIGSVFSPYYARARRRAGSAGADPLNHCAVNVALYNRGAGGARGGQRWAMTERGHGQVQRDAHNL